MKTLFVLVALTSSLCRAEQREEALAPSGHFSVRADVPVEEVSPSFRFRVRLVIAEVKTKKEWSLFSGVEGRRWAVVWKQDDALILYTPDRTDESHPVVFEWKEGRFVDRAPTDEEISMGREACDRKYRQKKAPNQASEPTAPSGRGSS